MEEEKRITTPKPEGFFKKYGFYIALIVLLGIIACPTPDGLSIAGQRMLGIMIFPSSSGPQQQSPIRSVPVLSSHSWQYL